MQDNPGSIADTSRVSDRTLFFVVLALAGAAGVFGVWHYAGESLTLSHYDARGHLIVSRRVIDSLTPGWRQFGAVWLPLPHLLNFLPVQWDWAYRTGIVSALISSGILAWGLAALSRVLFTAIGSLEAAVVAPLLVLANPNVLYLQSTPMTEPILFGLALVAIDAVERALAGRGSSGFAGLILAALVLTRYEGWLIAGALVALAAIVARLRGQAFHAAFVTYPAAALIAFFFLSWASTGRWVASRDFYVADPSLLHQPAVVLAHFGKGVVDLASGAVLWSGVAGAVAVLGTSWRRPERLLLLAPFATAALPLWAFYEGHPYRVRYMLTTVVALSALAPVLVPLLPRRLQLAAAVLLAVIVIRERAPLDPLAPMIQESQWETPYRLGRQAVTAALAAVHDGTPIMASMGSLGHYMQEASHAGFALRDFLHEGNGDLWREAYDAPRRSVRWLLIEERAEGGDMLAARAARDPSFLDGFERAGEGGGLVLYRRID